MPTTRSQTKAKREVVSKTKDRQKNAKVADHPSAIEAEKWKKAHEKALSDCVKDPTNVYRDPCSPVFVFFALNEEIQKLNDPWHVSEDGWTPSSFTYEIFRPEHFACMHAWRQWRSHVPRPE